MKLKEFNYWISLSENYAYKLIDTFDKETKKHNTEAINKIAEELVTWPRWVVADLVLKLSLDHAKKEGVHMTMVKLTRKMEEITE